MRILQLTVLSAVFVYILIQLPTGYGKDVSASGTGVGIILEGPLKAQLGDRIEYTVSVINLGSFWVRNLTVINTLPDGTSQEWMVSSLAPQGQTGNSQMISGIFYVIRTEDIVIDCHRYVLDHAEVNGLADVEGVFLPTSATTDYPTFVVEPPVACFTISRDYAPISFDLVFNSSCSYDPDGWIIKYEWDWDGDGIYDFDAGSNSTTTHEYAQPGTYYPTLRVTDNDNMTDATSKRAVIYTPSVGGQSFLLTATQGTVTIQIDTQPMILLVELFVLLSLLFSSCRHIRRTTN